MKKQPHRLVPLLMTCLIVGLCSPGLADDEVPLSSLDLIHMSAGWGNPVANRSIQKGPLSIGGKQFTHGVGTHAHSVVKINLGESKRFTAMVGVDDGAGKGRGSVVFRALLDGDEVFRSAVMKSGDPAVRVDLDLTGKKTLVLQSLGTDDGIDYDHANWAEAVFLVAGRKPATVDPIDRRKIILTPKPGPEPKINGPRLYGARPGRPFVYRIPCTGNRPMTFSVDGLPEGMTLDAATGIISGEVPTALGKYPVTLRAKNDAGEAEKAFTLVVGETLALTPPMGWNSWYIHYHRVTEQHMRDAADAMIASGMADHGYQYVNIDDCWMKQRNDPPFRDDRGNILTNAKFPDIKGMVDYIHAKGLKAGVYTSPGPWTCAGYVGSFRHEEKDARQFADWGFDFVKYDWCTYGHMVPETSPLADLKKPYVLMGDILKESKRDMVYNLCQYGIGDVWKWGGEVEGNCWRTTGDLGNIPRRELPGFYPIGLANMKLWKYAKPGQWNDPDYILIGMIGDPHRRHGEEARISCNLTGNEQYSYMSMWCLMAAPLIFSGDMAELDEFTLNVLCNSEVLDVDQDALGKQAEVVRHAGDEVVLAKPMEDGSMAVGLFNLGEEPRPVKVAWAELRLTGPRIVRDLWRQKDLGQFDDEFTATVESHGVVFVRLRPAE
ncbi:MAG TPA: alpha-galactosidase [Planctomycetaceae bacterium]|nr:alpha-galactosidase [Planctomycetaceae bacterium]